MTDLATIDGKSLEVFKSDPINDLLYSMGLEMQKNGLEIAQKAYDHYFVNNKGSDDIVTQYGQVCNLKKNPFPILNDLIPFSLQFTSDIGFFKCVDDSVKLLSQFNDQPVYYYHYSHRGQDSITKMLDLPKDSDFGELNLRIIPADVNDQNLIFCL